MHRGKMIDLYTTTTLAIYNQADYNALSTKLDVPCIINKITDWAMAVKGLVRVPPLSSGVCVSQQLRLQGGLVEQECIGFADCTTQDVVPPVEAGGGQAQEALDSRRAEVRVLRWEDRRTRCVCHLCLLRLSVRLR